VNPCTRTAGFRDAGDAGTGRYQRPSGRSNGTVLEFGAESPGDKLIAKGEAGDIIEGVIILRITEAELARDLHAVLEGVQRGNEVIIEREDHRPVAVIRAPLASGRPITEILREAKRRGSTVTLDGDFGKDLDEIIAASQVPWEPPCWD